MAILAQATVFRGDLWLSSFYSPEFVSELKHAIPYRRRVWYSSRSLWRIDKRHGDTLEALLNRHFADRWRYVAAAELGLLPGTLPDVEHRQAPQKPVSRGSTDTIRVFVGRADLPGARATQAAATGAIGNNGHGKSVSTKVNYRLRRP